MTSQSQSVNKRLVAGDISACGTEGFGKSAHEDIDRTWRNIEVVRDASAVRAKSANGVCFIDE
jgi:hypothetical protein